VERADRLRRAHRIGGGQVDVSMRDVMLSQLNYRAAAWLNDGSEHDGFWRSFAAEAGIAGFATMAERTSRRAEVLAVVTMALAADTVGRFRLVGSPVRVAGYHPAYRPPPGLGEHG
jgi:CoA:oxalate CoA-transferase